MITVEDLLMAYASAYDAWLDPEAERKNPTPEYAKLIRQAVSFENAKLRELVRHLRECTRHNVCAVCEYADDACDFDYDMRELGIEVER